MITDTKKENDLIKCDDNIIHQNIIDKVKSKMPGSEKMNSLSEIFKSMGDVTRIKILNALLISEMCVCDLQEVLTMSQSAISHQLKTLKQAKLVKFRREGKMIFYSLDDKHIKQLIKIGLLHLDENK